MNLVGFEKEGDFPRSGFLAVGAVDSVSLHVRSQIAPNRARGCLGRIGCPYDLPGLSDRVFSLQHGDEDRTRRDVFRQASVEGPLLVHGIEGLGLDVRQRTSRAAAILRPADSNRFKISPIRPLSTASGLIIHNVLSVIKLPDDE